jgi:hypothetical protein
MASRLTATSYDAVCRTLNKKKAFIQCRNITMADIYGKNQAPFL